VKGNALGMSMPKFIGGMAFRDIDLYNLALLSSILSYVNGGRETVLDPRAM
jgi:hypothetical protein